MTKTEFKLAAHLLEMAADKFANHVCNDLPGEILAMATEEEKAIIAKEFGKFNEHTETPEEQYEFDSLGDSALMRFLADKLEKLADTR